MTMKQNLYVTFFWGYILVFNLIMLMLGSPLNKFTFIMNFIHLIALVILLVFQVRILLNKKKDYTNNK